MQIEIKYVTTLECLVFGSVLCVRIPLFFSPTKANILGQINDWKIETCFIGQILSYKVVRS